MENRPMKITAVFLLGLLISAVFNLEFAGASASTDDRFYRETQLQTKALQDIAGSLKDINQTLKSMERNLR